MKKETKSIIFNIFFIGLTSLACVLLLSAIITLLKYKDLIQKDPVTYVMDNMNFTSCYCELESGQVAFCECQDKEMKRWKTHGRGFIHETDYGSVMRDSLLKSINISE